MSKVQRVAPCSRRKGTYVAKGYSHRYWDDCDAKKSTRQILKQDLVRRLREDV